ncbi:PREDICTED: protein Asterix-like [Brassica oleracea var. oleracea]|uniref:protein Asterix-like n=1 Tax=Brassica oleracea var. oleracea TaxID=109376 RepID=UPI0006A744FE|nr:PREDICTED: protein Asterix-like [Brassica oleracea var. oleracea]
MSHSHGNVSSGNDPRQPLAAKPYTPRPVAPEDLPVDYSGFIAVILGVSGVMFRYKICSWLAIIFCAQSLANMRNLENDLKQISMAMMYMMHTVISSVLLINAASRVSDSKSYGGCFV